MSVRAVFFGFALAAGSAVAATYEYLELVESPVFETPGTAPEITKRAKTCIAQIVRNDAFKLTDAGALPSGRMFTKKAGEEAAGDVILSVDEAAGTIVAASRVTYPGGITGDSSTRSTLTFLAKDGRFKIQHTNIETASANTGSLANPGYTRQGKWKFSQWEKADAALQALSSKLAECVKSAASASSW